MAAEAGRIRVRLASEADPSPLRVEEITDPRALEALAPEWASLFAADLNATPFQSPAWLIPWRRAFLAGGGLWTLAVRRGTALVGLAPFFVYTDPASGRRQLTLLGNGISDRQGLLADPEAHEAVVAAVAQRLAERQAPWDCADFRDLPEGSALLRLPLPGARELIEPDAPCPALDLPQDPVAVTAALPRSRRTDLRRCARRLAELGPVAVTRADAATLDEHLAALVDLHSARWRARGEPGVLAEPGLLRFHYDAAPALLAANLLRLEALRLGGRIIAVHYGLRRGACGFGYLHAFDPSLAAFGPGWLLMAAGLTTAVREGVRRFDFLRGREAYKHAWGATDQPQWRRRVWR